MQDAAIMEWREQYARCCLSVGFKPLRGATVKASVKPIFPELRTARAELSAGYLFRDDDLLRDGDDSLEVVVAQSPELNITHQGREIKLAAGDATTMQASAVGRVGSRESFRFLEVVISSAEWEARGARPEDGLMQRLSGKSEAVQLLHRYIGCVEKGLATSKDNRSIVRRHIVDLTVLAATTCCSIGESSASAVVATRLAAALDYIASHFSDPELSLTKVAQSLRISSRYLQRLLELSGTSFTAHVTELRLERAFMLLTAQGKGDTRICDVALCAGFSDISYFNRLFRSRFGDTPKGVRAHQSATISFSAGTLPFGAGAASRLVMSSAQARHDGRNATAAQSEPTVTAESRRAVSSGVGKVSSERRLKGP
jgi:AraC-like DNA-binding protein